MRHFRLSPVIVLYVEQRIRVGTIVMRRNVFRHLS